MAIGKDEMVRRQLRTLFNVGAVRELTDGQLLERFATDRGEAAELAFAVLVERHGPMVLRVCRGVLADPHDTQDAFQATFLVLVKRGRGDLGARFDRPLAAPGRLSDRLLRPDVRRAAPATRTRRGEDRARAPRPSRDVELGGCSTRRSTGSPSVTASPVVLCDLEGRTHEQAARHLGWPVGTVKSRLSRGRDRLRDRLIRRGLAPGVSLARGRGVVQGPGPVHPAHPAGRHDRRRGAIRRDRPGRPRVGSLTC